MKIGILAYHAAYNFGANLQVLSTFGFLKQLGFNPIVINWIPEDLELMYENTVPKVQAEVHKQFLNNYLIVTKLCRNEFDVAKVIQEEVITGIIIGSDAVVQHHPYLSRLVFPTKKIISALNHTSDRKFPNPFWGNFLEYLTNQIPVILMSVSSQSSAYKLIDNRTRTKMKSAIEKFAYISVRDKWTSDMFGFISNGNILPKITPDPVFAFNYNVIENQLSKEFILNKYSLPSKYILISFLDSKTVSKAWLKSFETIANNNGYVCVALPFPGGLLFDNSLEKCIQLPLSPLEWYALIKFSSGYIGHNMHPIVVSIHNLVPFFSFDHYGVVKFRYFVNNESSKIYHILSKSDLLEYRFSCVNNLKKRPDPKNVFEKIVNFNKNKCRNFANDYYLEYMKMMKEICNTFDSVKYT